MNFDNSNLARFRFRLGLAAFRSSNVYRRSSCNSDGAGNGIFFSRARFGCALNTFADSRVELDLILK